MGWDDSSVQQHERTHLALLASTSKKKIEPPNREHHKNWNLYIKTRRRSRDEIQESYFIYHKPP